MRAVDITRMVLGFVTFEASGGFNDKFLSALKGEGVNLLRMQHKNGSIIADVFIKDYRKMPRIRRKSEMVVHIVERHGMPFFIYKRRNRVGILIGAILFFAITAILSSCVWTIDVDGNDIVSQNVIKEVYEKNGVKVGSLMKKLNLKSIEESVVEEIPEVIWTAFNSSGGKGIIKVKEGEEIPKLKNSTPPQNVVAKFDGRITKYEVYEGSAEQTVNAAVTKGDLLISGILTFTDGSTLLRPADGKVEAETTRTVEAVIDDNFNLSTVQSTVDVHRVNFFGIRIPLYEKPFPKGKDKSQKKSDIPRLKSAYNNNMVLNKVMLPIGITEEKNIFLAKMTNTRYMGKGVEKRIILIGIDSFFIKQMEEMKDANIYENTITMHVSDSKVTYSGTFKSIENICDYVEIKYDEQV